MSDKSAIDENFATYLKLNAAANAEPAAPTTGDARCPLCRSMSISNTADGQLNCDNCKHRWPRAEPAPYFCNVVVGTNELTGSPLSEETDDPVAELSHAELDLMIARFNEDPLQLRIHLRAGDARIKRDAAALRLMQAERDKEIAERRGFAQALREQVALTEASEQREADLRERLNALVQKNVDLRRQIDEALGVTAEQRQEETGPAIQGAVELLIKREAELRAAHDRLWLALAFYADPETYHACAFAFDPPCGEFSNDFSYDADYDRDMPGKLARETLDALQTAPVADEETK